MLEIYKNVKHLFIVRKLTRKIGGLQELLYEKISNIIRIKTFLLSLEIVKY